MKKILFCILLCAAALMANGCAPVQVAAPSEALEPGVYRLSAPGSSRKILSETVKTAREQCEQENKQYLFVKNIFPHSSALGLDTVSYTLYFTCVEAQDPRLKQQRKPRQRPSEEKADEEQPEQKVTLPMDRRPMQPEVRPPEKAVPEKEKTPAPEPVEEKPAVSPAPAQEKPPPQEEKKELPKTDEEQTRKKNPGPGELEDLRPDSSPLYEESEDSPVIEESLEGEAFDRENYLKKRLRKKKKTN
ncbi:MAG: hypothetical protein V1782_07610 [Pseudomonadota bacterium]